MKAICWHGTRDVRYDDVPDPSILYPSDVVIRVTSTAICGSDLHLYNGLMPTMKAGDVLGHETMGVVVEKGQEVRKVQIGDRVVVPFTISCGDCYFFAKGLFAACDTSNPPASADLARKAMGASPAAMFGYSHMLGGVPGGQAELLRVPHADVGLLRIESDLPDEKVLFLSDIFPTGFMAAENAGIEPGVTVAVWGCGPVGQFVIKSAWMLGAGRVIAIDREPERLRLAREAGRAETLDFSQIDVPEALRHMTQGRGPDRCIDAVGTEAHGSGALHALDKAKTMVMKGADRAHVLRETMMCCRKAGTISVPGVYLGMVDEIPFGALVNKGLTIRSGQTHVQRFMRPLLDRILQEEIDPSFIITHRVPLKEAPEAYKTFLEKADGCVKVVLTP